MFAAKPFCGRKASWQKLLETLVAIYCKDQGYERLYLGTVEVLKAAQRFYQKHHFGVYALINRYAKGSPMDVDE